MGAQWREVLISAVALANGVVKNWNGFVPGVILGVLSLLGWAIPAWITVVVLSAGLAWGVLRTYHESRMSANDGGALSVYVAEGGTYIDTQIVSRAPAARGSVRIRGGKGTGETPGQSGLWESTETTAKPRPQ